MLTQDDQERESYESDLKARYDQYGFAKCAYHDEALERGFAEGFQQGFQLGLEIGPISLCQRLLKLPLTPLEELLGLPLGELHARAAALEQQLGAMLSVQRRIPLDFCTTRDE